MWGVRNTRMDVYVPTFLLILNYGPQKGTGNIFYQKKKKRERTTSKKETLVSWKYYCGYSV